MLVITIGISLASSHKALALAEAHDNVFATIGIHPHEALGAKSAVLEQLAALAAHPKVVAWGEIGLDYAKEYAPREAQQRAFSAQLALARELDLPIVVHDREAHADTLRLLRACGQLPRGGVIHCFSGDSRLAREVTEMGFYISIPGVVTFAKAEALREAVRQADLSRLLLETDGPFLAPAPYRGKRNEPGLLLYTARMVAEIQQRSLEEVAQATTENAARLFRLSSGGQQQDTL